MNKDYEDKLFDEGHKIILGIDEVGRGPFFGDVLACAIAFEKDFFMEEVNDSKKLSQKKREKIFKEIVKNAIGIGIGKASPEEIDKINIKEATHLAMQRAVEDFHDEMNNKIAPDIILIDAEKINIDIEQRAIVHGDATVFTIAAASIVAKVLRDAEITYLAQKYPEYDLENNKGYGTKKHREAILKYGPTPLHRKTFLRKLLGNSDAK